MRYLFFDIECCNGRDICEFGYVITDTDFNILEKKDYTINPENKFNLTGRPGRKDIHLHYPPSTYYKSPKFPYYYDTIKELIEYPDQLIVGHAISNDAIFIRTACKRYDLGPINFKFADSQKMYSEYANIRSEISLESAGDIFNVKKPEYIHKSDDDSELTMYLVKGMCRGMNCSLEELIELCDSCRGVSENFEIKYYDEEFRHKRNYEAAKDGSDNRIKGRNYRLFFQFLDGVKPKGDIIVSPLNGKSLCVSMNYEYGHFREMLSLVQLLVNHNATYKIKASENDMFVTYSCKDKDGNDIYCSRLKFVNEAMEAGKDIQIISLEELLGILGVKEEDLSNMPFPDESSFFRKPKDNQRRRSTEYKDNNSKGTTLGDLFPDLFAKLKENLDE